MDKRYFVYIMTNKTNTVLYTGFSGRLETRGFEHKTKIVESFTKKYNINKLVYYEEYASPLEGIAREKAIKNLVRRKKIQLIECMNPEWEDLYESFWSE